MINFSLVYDSRMDANVCWRFSASVRLAQRSRSRLRRRNGSGLLEG